MPYKILAVDDNPINLDLLEKSLVDSDYTFLRATSGEQGLQMALEQRPDLILLDVVMPQMDGFEVCRRLQAEETTRYIPVIFLSARNEVQFKARGLALGGTDYLTKPFNALELNARIRSHLSHRRHNIEILQKIRSLQESILPAGESQETEPVHPEQIAGMDRLWNENSVSVQPPFAVAVRVEKQYTLASTVFFPITADRDQLIYVQFAGMQTSVRTTAVQYMFKSYIDGFLQSKGTRSLQSNELVHLFESLLQAFSPDRYDVGFTFSLGCIDSREKRFSLFAIHQPFPYIFDNTGQLEEISGPPITLHAGYNEFVRTVQTDWHPENLLLHFFPKPSEAALELHRQALPGMNWEREADLENNMDILMENPAEITADRLTAVIKTLPGRS